MSLIPFDETGQLASNKKTETHVVSSINGVDHNFILPDWAPFFKTGFSIYHRESSRYLEENVDFIYTHYFEAAEDNLADMLYGSITLLDKNITGTFDLQLQSIGGDLVNTFTQALTSGVSTLADLQTVRWEDIIGVPTTFPVTQHTHTVEGIAGVTEALSELSLIRNAIESMFTNISAADITDLNDAFINPLLSNLSDLTAAIVANGFNSSLTAYKQTISGSSVNIGAISADVWTDLPLSVTVAVPGTYRIDHTVNYSTDATGAVRFRWVLGSGTVLTDSLARGGLGAIPAGTTIKLQVLIETTPATSFNISGPNYGSNITAVRLGN